MRRSRVLVAAAGLFLGLARACGCASAGCRSCATPHYEARAERNQEQRVLIRPMRGHLLDRRGRPLARDLLTYSISAAPREMKNARATARDLARAARTRRRAKLERSFAQRPRFLLGGAPRVAGARAARSRRGSGAASTSRVETRREYLLGAAAARSSAAPTSITSASMGSSCSSTKSCAAGPAGPRCSATGAAARTR